MKVLTNPKLYQKGRAFMTEDVNAAVRGLGRSGAQQVDVFDGHGMGGNLIVENLKKGVSVVRVADDGNE